MHPKAKKCLLSWFRSELVYSEESSKGKMSTNDVSVELTACLVPRSDKVICASVM